MAMLHSWRLHIDNLPSDSDHEDGSPSGSSSHATHSKHSSPPTSRIPMPPVDLRSSQLWSRVSVAVPNAKTPPDLRNDDHTMTALREEANTKRQELQDEIDLIVRTKGRTRRTEFVPLPPTSMSNKNPRATASNQAPSSSPSSIDASSSNGGGGGSVPREKRKCYIGMQTVALEVPMFQGVHMTRNKDVLAMYSPFRFSFITLFYVGLACGKFKSLLRRKTMAQQQVQYEQLLTKSIEARHELINRSEAKQYTLESIRGKTHRARNDTTNTIQKMLHASNHDARMTKLNPKYVRPRELSKLEEAPSKTSAPSNQQSAVSPAGMGTQLGDFFLLNKQNNHIVANPLHSPHHSTTTGFFTTLVDVPYHYHSSFSVEPSPRHQQLSSAGQPSQQVEPISPLIELPKPRPLAEISFHGSPRSVTMGELPSFSHRALPIFEQYSDKNAFVLNALWEDMTYLPIKDRARHTITYRKQAHESGLQPFTQTILPASTERVQEGGRDAVSSGDAEEDGDTRMSPTALMSKPSFFSIGVDSLIKQHMADHLQTLHTANPDVDLKLIVPFIPGQRNTVRTYDIKGGLRATRSVAKPSAEPFNFYAWRVRQNRAMFHHLCVEHRDLTANAVNQSADSPKSSNVNATSLNNQQDDHAMQKEMQALRERVRKRAEDITYNEEQSATHTYNAFLVHRELEHVEFLQRAEQEVLRLISTKQSITNEEKKRLVEDRLFQDGVALSERFLGDCSKFDKSLQRGLERQAVAENEQYSTNWILTMQNRVEQVFSGHLPPEAKSVVAFALATVKRCSHRELKLSDLEEGVFNALDAEELLSPACQFMLERLLPAFSAAECSLMAAKGFLKKLFDKRKFPYTLLTQEEEADAKAIYGLDDNARAHRRNHKTLSAIQRLNGIMEPVFDRQATLALNAIEARHAKMRLEARRIKEQLAQSEEQALVKAATLARRTSRSVTCVSGPSSHQSSGEPHRRSIVSLALGIDALSPASEKMRQRRKSSVTMSLDAQDSTHSNNYSEDHPHSSLSLAPFFAVGSNNNNNNNINNNTKGLMTAAESIPARVSSQVTIMAPLPPPSSREQYRRNSFGQVL